MSSPASSPTPAVQRQLTRPTEGAKLLALSLILLSVALAGCMGEPFAEAYTARGAADTIRDLAVTETFDVMEDLQLVVRFNQHSKSVRLETVWYTPEGTEAGALQAIVPADTEYIAVTYDLENAGRRYWPPGAWTVEVRVDGKLEATVGFTVTGDIPEDTIGDEAGDAAGEEGTDGFDIDNPTNPFGG